MDVRVGCKPDSGWYCLIIHTDASCKEHIVGIGYIIRHENQNYENAAFEKGDYTSMDGEFIALREAATVAARHFDAQDPVLFYTDCQALVDKLNAPESDKWAKRAEELDLIMRQEFSVRWVPRERNREADSLAGTGRRRGETRAAD